MANVEKKIRSTQSSAASKQGGTSMGQTHSHEAVPSETGHGSAKSGGVKGECYPGGSKGGEKSPGTGSY